MKYAELDLLVWDSSKEDKVRINADMAFLFYQRYGFPPEMFEEEVNLAFKDFNVKAYHFKKAYDKAHGRT